MFRSVLMKISAKNSWNFPCSYKSRLGYLTMQCEMMIRYYSVLADESCITRIILWQVEYIDSHDRSRRTEFFSLHLISRPSAQFFTHARR